MKKCREQNRDAAAWSDVIERPGRDRLEAIHGFPAGATAVCVYVQQKWADRAAALASYARQIKDRSLVNMALRIYARAYEQASKLVKQVPKGKTGPKQLGKADFTKSGKTAANEAELSQHQRRVVQRIGNIPQDEFDQRV